MEVYAVPGGSRIIYFSIGHIITEPKTGIYIANSDGSNRRLLTSGGLVVSEPEWQPTG